MSFVFTAWQADKQPHAWPTDELREWARQARFTGGGKLGYTRFTHMVFEELERRDTKPVEPAEGVDTK